MNEIWKDIPSFEGLYQISDLGRVKSLERICSYGTRTDMLLKEKILKPSFNSDGYYIVNLYKDNKMNGRRVHQLVALAFLNHIPNGTSNLVCDHINSIKIDNRLINLRLISNRDNTLKDKFNKTGFKGISLAPSGKFCAKIQYHNKHYNLGYYITPEEASNVYKETKLLIEQGKFQ